MGLAVDLVVPALVAAVDAELTAGADACWLSHDVRFILGVESPTMVGRLGYKENNETKKETGFVVSDASLQLSAEIVSSTSDTQGPVDDGWGGGGSTSTRQILHRRTEWGATG